MNEPTAAAESSAPAEIDWVSSSNDEDRAGFSPAERARVADPTPPPSEEPESPHTPEDGVVEGDDTEAKADKLAIDEDDDAPVDDADTPPEFWSAEKKALWAQIQDPALKAAIKEHERTASTATSKRMEEAALKVKAAEEAAKAALDQQAQAVQWWQQSGPILEQMVKGRWAQVDWNSLVNDNPAEYVRLKAQYEQEMGVLQGVAAKHQENVKAMQERAQAAEMQARVEHHKTLAEKYPKEFGDTKTAEQTYGVLSNWLAKQGFPVERISAIYEAPVVEVIRKAYKYDQLRQKASEVTKPKPDVASASTTPKRVVPGPAKTGNPSDEAYRQAIGRLRSGQKLSEEEGRLVFR